MIDGGLRPLFRKRLTGFHFTSVETPGTGSGVPDMEYCAEGVSGWIECKKATGYAVRLRPEQIGWLTTRARHGGRCWIAVRRMGAADELYIYPGSVARDLKEQGLRLTPAGCWPGGPARWNWQEVRALLLE